MSSTAKADVCCANCGAAEDDDIKLEDCDGCDLVKYCRDKCREEHRWKHEEECSKRKVELHDKELFSQPDGTHLGECPLCFLPLPIDTDKSGFWTCCSEIICLGCVYANDMSNINDDDRCPFCREPSADDDENKKRMMKRVKANDPVAMSQMGTKCFSEGDYDGAFEYLTKAAELGDLMAHYHSGVLHMNGEGVQKDEEKMVYHWEMAAIGGHPMARHLLAIIEEDNGNMERAVKHYIIAASLGDELSMKRLWKAKEDLDATLRSHHAAIDAMKSEQRDIADKNYGK